MRSMHVIVFSSEKNMIMSTIIYQNLFLIFWEDTWKMKLKHKHGMMDN